MKTQKFLIALSFVAISYAASMQASLSNKLLKATAATDQPESDQFNDTYQNTKELTDLIETARKAYVQTDKTASSLNNFHSLNKKALAGKAHAKVATLKNAHREAANNLSRTLTDINTTVQRLIASLKKSLDQYTNAAPDRDNLYKEAHNETSKIDTTPIKPYKKSKKEKPAKIEKIKIPKTEPATKITSKSAKKTSKSKTAETADVKQDYDKQNLF